MHMRWAHACSAVAISRPVPPHPPSDAPQLPLAQAAPPVLPTVVSRVGLTGMGTIPYPIRLVTPGLTWLRLCSNSNAPGARAYSGLRGGDFLSTRKTQFGRLTVPRTIFFLERLRVSPIRADSARRMSSAYMFFPGHPSPPA